MNNSLLMDLRNNLNRLIESGSLDGKYIVLFGMNTPGDEVINYLARKGYQVRAVIDNNPGNKGKKLTGVLVDQPDGVLGTYRKDAVILICSRYFSEMKKQLMNMGYEDESQIFKILEMNNGSKYTTDIQVFQEEIKKLQCACAFYRKFQSSYGERIRLLVAPVKANGDVYIISSMLQEYIEVKGYENAKFAVIGGACKRIASMFGIEDAIQITQEEMEQLVLLSRFLGADNCGIEIIQPYYMYTGIFTKMEGYKALNFMDFFRLGYMNGVKNRKEPLPAYRENLRDNKYGIIKDRTFILAPYANSLPQIEWKLWEKLAAVLKEKGYQVFTNSASEDEPVINGTDKIFFPIEDTVKVLNYAGGFLAMRNGLCEVASGADCRQIIIYPDKAAGYAKVKDVYGIKAMGLNELVDEIEEQEGLVEKIDKMLSVS